MLSTRSARFALIAALAFSVGCSNEQLGATHGTGTGGASGAGGVPIAPAGAGGEQQTPDGGGVDAACRQTSDCRSDLLCWPAGVPACGIDFCSSMVVECSDDSDCAGDAGVAMICDLIGCGCRQCHPGCSADGDCDPGLICGADHRCDPAPCGDGGADCPVDFTCGADGHCARKACSSAADCSSACVQGVCYGEPGYCTPVVF